MDSNRTFSPHGYCNGPLACKLPLNCQNNQISTDDCGTVSFYYVNATSLAKSNAVQQLHTDIIEHDVDVALVAESWFTVKHCDQDIEIDQYKLFRRDRIQSTVRVVVYVRMSEPVTYVRFSILLLIVI